MTRFKFEEKFICDILRTSSCKPADIEAVEPQLGESDIWTLSDLGDQAGAAEARIKEIIAASKIDEAGRKCILEFFVGQWNQAKVEADKKDEGSVEAVLEVIGNLQERDVQAVVQALAKEGIKQVDQLGEDNEAASQKIDEVVTSKLGLSPEKVERIKKGLNYAADAVISRIQARKPSTAKHSGTVDIMDASFPSLRAEKDGTITAFTIPAVFKGKDDPNHPYVSPDTLYQWQWIHLAKINNLTRALHLTDLFNGSPFPYAQAPAFHWDLDNTNFGDISAGEADSFVSTSIAEDRTHNTMAVEGSIQGNYAFAEASVKASYFIEAANSEYSKRIYVRMRWKQPRCVLFLKECLSLAPLFQHLVNVGLDPKIIPEDDQYDYFVQLFDLFGHLAPEKVFLGGVLENSKQLISVEKMSKETVKRELDVEVTAKFNKGAGGSLAIGYADDGSGMVTQANVVETHSFKATGGDPGKESEPDNWKPTANDPDKWKTVSQEGFAPITDWFDADTKQKFNEMLDKTKKNAWLPGCDPTEFDKGHVKLPKESLPYFPSFLHKVTLRRMYRTHAEASASGIGGFLWHQHGDYLTASNGVTVRPPMNAFDDTGKALVRFGVPPTPATIRFRIAGTYWNHCQPAPLRAALSQAANAEASNLLWMFIYTGKTTEPLGEPLFYLVTQDRGWLLSVFEVPEGKLVPVTAFACLYPFDSAADLTDKDSPWTWVLRPAVPPGRLMLPAAGGGRGGWFRLFNPFHRRYLADTWTMHSRLKSEQLGVRFENWKEEVGSDYTRTMLRGEPDLSPVFGNDGKPIKSKEESQSSLFADQCWYIQDRSPEPKLKVFHQLDKTYRDNWIKESQAFV